MKDSFFRRKCTCSRKRQTWKMPTRMPLKSMVYVYYCNSVIKLSEKSTVFNVIQLHFLTLSKSQDFKMN